MQSRFMKRLLINVFLRNNCRVLTPSSSSVLYASPCTERNLCWFVTLHLDRESHGPNLIIIVRTQKNTELQVSHWFLKKESTMLQSVGKLGNHNWKSELDCHRHWTVIRSALVWWESAEKNYMAWLKVFHQWRRLHSTLLYEKNKHLGATKIS